jgi:peptidyl-tRNA hydrolase, PTH1 family
MGLFQRNPYQSSELQQLYNLGQNKSVLIVGLGNQGKKYESTRHNLGFICIDTFAKSQDFESWVEKKDLKAQLTMKTMGDTRVILCKPTTMMNLSGEAVQKVSSFYKIAPAQIVVVYDELAIPFGQIRVRGSGSSAGHNGIKSLLQHVGDAFARIRIGIGSSAKEQLDSADFVLAKLSKDEQAKLPDLTREVSSLIGEFIASGQLLPDTRSFIVL